ncbi:type VII secretion target [Nocardia sp. NPDC003963]
MFAFPFEPHRCAAARSSSRTLRTPSDLERRARRYKTRESYRISEIFQTPGPVYAIVFGQTPLQYIARLLFPGGAGRDEVGGNPTMTAPNVLNVDPETLRRLALQHEEAAQEIAVWARIPTRWLAEFDDGYGRFSFVVRQAMEIFFESRRAAGNALAEKHTRIATLLRASADNYERVDQLGAARIRSVDFSDPVTPQQYSGTTPDLGASRDDRAQRSSNSGGPPLPQRTGRLDGTQPPRIPSLTGIGESPADGTDVPDRGSPATELSDSSGPVSRRDGEPSPHVGSASSPPTVASAANTPARGPTVGSSPGRSVSTSPRSVGPVTPPVLSVTQEASLIQPVTPFAVAVSAERAKKQSSSMSSGPADTDLVIARTLLGAVLAAGDRSVAQPAWAVSVMRGLVGARIFITSNEGRGWLPTGLYLPSEVSTPWMWDHLLDTGGTGVSPGWEGIRDPARILGEFGNIWGPQVGTGLTALVSSEPIPPSVRSIVAGARTEQLVQPSSDPDLRIPGPDTVDRLGLTGSTQSLQNLAAIPDSHIRGRQIELAVHAHQHTAKAGTRPIEAADIPGLRDRILAYVQAGVEVPASWWDELREVDSQLSAISMGPVAAGITAPGSAPQQLRARGAYFERRSNEIVLMLAADPTRQTLRDSVYAHREIVNHPMFVRGRSMVSATTDDRPRRVAGAGTGGIVSATGSSGPLAGQGYGVSGT